MSDIDLASRLEAVVATPHATSAEVHKSATEAMRFGLPAICVTPVWTNRVATMLRGSGVRVVSLVGFPFGTHKSTIKAIEATSTIKDGADEIEVVAHLPYLLAGDLDAARAELMEIVRAARSTRRDVAVRVIVETPLLSNENLIEIACRAVRESGCDAIVTSAGVQTRSSDIAAELALLKKFGEGLMIKAVVLGTSSSEAVRTFLVAGADRIASSRVSEILKD